MITIVLSISMYIWVEKGQMSMVCGPDLAHGPPFEKACPTSSVLNLT